MRKLSDQSVECWFLDQHEARHETWALALTTVGERSRADGFRHLVDRRAFLVRRGFLRSVLSIYLGIPANMVQIHVGSSGKPYINSQDGIFFSCSSSREIAVIAIARHPKIGVDFEALGQSADVGSIASAFFSRSEQRLVEATMVQYSCSKSDATLYVWTQKEAYLKALGVGLKHLRDFEIQYVEGNATVAESSLELGTGATVLTSEMSLGKAVFSIATPPHYSAARYYFIDSLISSCDAVVDRYHGDRDASPGSPQIAATSIETAFGRTARVFAISGGNLSDLLHHVRAR